MHGIPSNKSNKRIAVIAAIAVVLSVAIFAVAKYIVAPTTGYKQADPAAFHLVTSIEPNDSAHPYICADDIRFSVSNSDGINVSETDITYNVAISGTGSDDATISIDGTNTDSATLEVNGTTPVQSDISIADIPNGDYTVTVSSSYPYTQTVTLYFRLSQGSKDTTYKATSHGTWTELDIYTGSDADNITIEYAGFAPDNTNEYMADWSKDGPEELEDIVLNAHYKLVFFGDGEFTLTQSGHTLGLHVDP